MLVPKSFRKLYPASIFGNAAIGGRRVKVEAAVISSSLTLCPGVGYLQHYFVLSNHNITLIAYIGRNTVIAAWQAYFAEYDMTIDSLQEMLTQMSSVQWINCQIPLTNLNIHIREMARAKQKGPSWEKVGYGSFAKWIAKLFYFKQF